jgi:hypothetical protein
MSELQIVSRRLSVPERSRAAARLRELRFVRVAILSPVAHELSGDAAAIGHADLVFRGAVAQSGQEWNFHHLQARLTQDVDGDGTCLVYARSSPGWEGDAFNNAFVQQWHKQAIALANTALETVGVSARFDWPERSNSPT